jgi:hypothetical protein
MNQHENQRNATLNVAKRRQDAPSGDGEPPRVGDTFLSRHSADYPVEWLTVDHNGGRRFQVVALDVHPFVGSRDVERTAPGATGVVRCDVEAELDAAELETNLRTGTLTSAEMDEVRRRRQAIADETLVATLREEEVDTDPEYRLWRDETLRPALASLGRTDDSDVLVFPDRWRRWRSPLAAAALLALAVPLALQYERQGRQLQDERAQRTAVEREHRAQAEELHGVVAEVGRLETSLAEQKDAFDQRLEGVFDDRVVVNLPSFVLGGEARRLASRGLPEVLEPGDALRFTLSLEVTDPEPYFRYRLRLVKKEGGREIWSNDQLKTVNGKWLRLDLPTNLLDPGAEYELQVDGMKTGAATLLTERYRIQINR